MMPASGAGGRRFESDQPHDSSSSLIGFMFRKYEEKWLKKQNEIKKNLLPNAYSLFVYAIRTQITRDYYLRRLRTFFDYIKLLPKVNKDRRCNNFAALASTDKERTSK